MPLMKLPAEILHQVIIETIPEGFESTALTCKPIYEAAAPLLKQYNKLRKRFRNFAFSTFNIPIKYRPYRTKAECHDDFWDPITRATGIPIKTTIELLMHIAREPIIARYIETADFKLDHSLNQPDYEDPEDPFVHEWPPVKGDTSVLRQLLLDSPYIRQTDLSPEAWFEEMLKHAKGHAEAFLLTLLPNLTRLAPQRGWDRLSYRIGGNMSQEETEQLNGIWSLLETIIRRANDPKIKGASLSKLQTIMPFRGYGYEARAPFSVVPPFLALDSVRDCHVSGCVAKNDSYTGMEFIPRYETYGKGLETLEIVGVVFGHQELRALLSRIPNLKRFRLAYEYKWHGCGGDWNIGASLGAVQDCLGSTLEELSFTHLVGLAGRGTCLNDLTGFKHLRMLEITLDAFLGPPYDKDSKVPEWKNEQDPPGDPAFPRLVDLLPATLETLRIYIHHEKKSSWVTERQGYALERLFECFQEKREVQLPRLLENVEVHCPESIRDTDYRLARVVQVIAESGVQVVYAKKCEPSFVTTFSGRCGVSSEM